MSNVTSADQASYYRLLMTTGSGRKKKDVFQDFDMNGNRRAEGGYKMCIRDRGGHLLCPASHPMHGFSDESSSDPVSEANNTEPGGCGLPVLG